MMPEFTPGPWVASKAHTSATFWRVESDAAGYPNDGWIVAGEVHGPDSEANARLIAAAPELHDSIDTPNLRKAAKLLTDAGHGLHAGLLILMADAQDAALAKARGEVA